VISIYIPWWAFLIIFICSGFGYAYYINSKAYHPYDFMTPMIVLAIIVGTVLISIAFLIGKFLC